MMKNPRRPSSHRSDDTVCKMNDPDERATEQIRAGLQEVFVERSSRAEEPARAVKQATTSNIDQTMPRKSDHS